jgi:hypothetical protein
VPQGIQHRSGHAGLQPRGGRHAGQAERFEQERCRAGGIVKDDVDGAPVSWKMSVNARSTSATIANSSLIYYHFARYFVASVHVPASVRARRAGLALERMRLLQRDAESAWLESATR